MESNKKVKKFHYPIQVSKVISLKQKIIIRFLKKYVIFYDNITFSKPMPIYMAKCKIHGYFLDYLHGYNNRLDCPKCSERFYEQIATQRKTYEQLAIH